MDGRTCGATPSWSHGLDPWLIDHAAAEHSIKLVLQHELAHAIAGIFSHEDYWFEMCEIIGYELTPGEKDQYGWHDWSDAFRKAVEAAKKVEHLHWG